MTTRARSVHTHPTAMNHLPLLPQPLRGRAQQLPGLQPTTPPLHTNTRMTRLLLALTLLGSTALRANNIQVSNVTLVNPNTTDQTVDVQFTVSWENSWRTSSDPATWDAAWVFVKYRDAFTGVWQHCRLGNVTDHVPPTGTAITNGLLEPATAYNAATNYGVGAFVYRSENGTGTFTCTGVRLRWNYGQNGVIYNNLAEVRVFALEMVHVAQGSFWVGDGGTGSGRFIAGGSTNSPFQITSEAALGVANTAGSLWGTSTTGFNSIGAAGTMPTAYPKGFNAFYCMKYEISQQGYVDFLNTLTYVQQTTRTATAPNSAAGTAALFNTFRNGIDIQTPGVASSTPAVYACNLNGNTVYGEATDGLWIACNHLSWGDVAAYLDWSCLRPMTELEYEKACRGPVTPVADEYAWGSIAITGYGSVVTNAGAANEGCGTAGANAVFGSAGLAGQGPIRVGAFATSSSARPQSGASYYGAMELSGNTIERTVTVADAGRTFAGTHGDGALNASNGDANPATWPNATASGAGFRGAGWFFPSGGVEQLRVSDRTTAAVVDAGRYITLGGRGCRLAP